MHSYRAILPQGTKPLPRYPRPVNGHYSDLSPDLIERQKAIKRILAVESKAFYAPNQVADHIVIVAQKLFGYGNRFNVADYKTSELRQLASFLEQENS